MFVCLFSLLVVYAALLLWMARGFWLTPAFTARLPKEALGATIIVCAKNEEQYIATCLTSIIQQNYERDKIQLLFVNDASTDHTLEIANKILAASDIDFQIINNTEALGKKKSIVKAMAFATNEFIVSRDADTITQSPSWLRQVTEFKLHERADFIIAPVAMYDTGSFLKALQAIENNVLTVISAGSTYLGKAFLCSGANMAYTKTLFQETGSFASHLHIPSGDDVLFLDDVKKLGGKKISFLRSTDAVVQTFPAASLKSLFRQRVRWAAKFRFNSSSLNLFLALLVFGVNLSFLYCLAGIAFLKDTPLYSLFIICKLCIDIILLILASTLIKNRHLFWFIMPVAFVYPFYAVAVALAAVFTKPSWK